MKTQVQPTSIYTFRTQIEPTLGARQKAVYDFLSSVLDATNKEIANHFECDACSITGRIKELREMNLVYESMKRECRVTGRTAIAWKVVNFSLI